MTATPKNTVPRHTEWMGQGNKMASQLRALTTRTLARELERTWNRVLVTK
jgi:hypothetical protein